MKNIPFILDCDTGEDDAIAIALAVNAKLPLKYIVTCHGNTTLNHATNNSSRILSLTNAAGIEVIKGASGPLETHKTEGEGFTVGEDFLGKNGLCNIQLPESQYDNILDYGEDKYIEELAKKIQAEGKVDYVITGPATNFAKLCMYMGDDIKKYINKLIIMGGALYSEGTRGAGIKHTSHEEENRENIEENVEENTGETWAEFNFYCDPLAIDIVFKAGLNPTVVTWDQCIPFEVPLSYINELHSDTPGGKFVIDLMKAFMDLYGTEHKTNFELCDPLTIMAYMGYGRKKDESVSITTTKEFYGKSTPQIGDPIQYFYTDSIHEREYIVYEMMQKLGITLPEKRIFSYK